MRTGLLLAAALLFSLSDTGIAQPDLSADHLDGTEPLLLEEPLDVVMVRGINYFAEREIADSPNRRPAKWNRDYSSVEAYEKSVEPNRQRLREIIGAVDERAAHQRHLISLPLMPDEPRELSNIEPVKPLRVRWDVLPGVTAEGVYLAKDPFETPSAVVILLPDADTSPESMLQNAPGREAGVGPGLLVSTGCHVVIPTLISRSDEFSGHPDIRYTNQPHREYVYRMAFEMGRHVIGYEVQKVLSAVDWIEERHTGEADVPILVAGAGEGGLIALHSAAVDLRIDGALISGYFGPREAVWAEPIYRNVWSQVAEFGDADLASLIAPRPLVVEPCAVAEIAGPPAPADGRSGGAAPGRIQNVSVDAARGEFDRAQRHYSELGQPSRIEFIASADGSGAAGSPEAWRALFLQLVTDPASLPEGNLIRLEEMQPVDERARQQSQVRELVDYTQKLLHRSDKARDKRWGNVDRSSVEACITSLDAYRRDVYDNMIGRLPEPHMPLNARTRKVLDEETHVGYEVMLDCYPAGDTERPIPEGANTAIPDTGSVDSIGWAVGKDWGVIAGGILLLPKDLKEGEQRPVVVCQHGLEGVPMDTITTDPAASGYGPYKGFSTQLVKRGFIVYAPQNPYRGRDAFRVIQRKSNPMGRSLFSYIIPQHQRTITWLASLPFVDRNRIAFYGLSYGGKTAVRVPPMLVPQNPGADTPGSPGYCLSICSADFNEWVRKNTSSEDRYSYVYTPEYEIFEWNMGHVANYAELSYLMTPRPFMVERGHDDGVAPDEWVAWEYAKVKRHYDKLGIGELTEMEVFNGPHTINGVGTFDFLHRHLDWPQAEFKPL
jgi:cephalosporin-C deacetylase-like acetyl esterase